MGQGWTSGSLITLAGLATEDAIWPEVEKQWAAILHDDKNRPRAKYLHMKEAIHCEREFSYRNGWNQKKVFSLIMDLLMYLQTVDKKRFRQFACTVDLGAHRKLITEGYNLDNPIEICNSHCPFSVLAWYAHDYPGLIHSAHYFFDQNEPFEVPFKLQWTRETQRAISPGGMDMFWSLIKTVSCADMRTSPALQAADMLAWATNRALFKPPDEPVLGKHLEHIMKQIIPSGWILWDERKFRGAMAHHDQRDAKME